MNHDDLWKILSVVATKLNVELQQEALIRIGQVSDGFPHYVHLIGESMFCSMFDDPDEVRKSDSRHYKEGIKGALQRTEAALKAQYEKATQKYRNTQESRKRYANKIIRTETDQATGEESEHAIPFMKGYTVFVDGHAFSWQRLCELRRQPQQA